jgi:hypothetical protein
MLIITEKAFIVTIFYDFFTWYLVEVLPVRVWP